MKTNKHQTDIDRRTERAAKMLGGVMRVSGSNVPHVVVTFTDGREASVCFFGSSQQWRVFYPYVSSEQEKTTHNSLEEVEARLEDIERYK